MTYKIKLKKDEKLDEVRLVAASPASALGMLSKMPSCKGATIESFEYGDHLAGVEYKEMRGIIIK